MKHQTGAISRRLGHEAHAVAASFTAFLTDWASRLEAGLHEVDPRTGRISRFPLRHVGNSDVTSFGIRVRVSVLFLPENSRPAGVPDTDASGDELPPDSDARYVFAYRVTISCVDPAVRRCRLTTRTWRCFHDNGEQHDEIHGPGVIGLYPVLYCAPFIFPRRPFYFR